MPGKKDGRLTPEEKQKAVAWLEAQCGKDAKCPMCQHEHWILSDHFTAPTVWGGGYIIGGVAYPCFSIICGKCGYQAFFNATLARILPPDEKIEKEKQAKLEAELMAEALKKEGADRG
jgi:hypothetical protein